MTPESSLAGKRVLITRPRAQAAALAEKLAALGAVPILFPTIEIASMVDDTPLVDVFGRLEAYHWIVFTSANGVAVFCDRLAGGLPPAVRLAAIGPATARALEQRGLAAAFIPDEYVAEALAAGLGDVAGRHVLLPHAELAREALAEILRQRGAEVDEIAVYRTLPAAPDPAGLAELQRGVDAITFTSASAARNFAHLVLAGGLMGETSGPAIACIGPVTAAAAREASLRVDVVAAEYTLDGLVRALAEHLARPLPQLKENRWTLPPQ